MNLTGYARVSTSGQTLDAQLEQFGAAECDQVFKETVSGARSDRPELKKALDALIDGDVLIVMRLESACMVNTRSSGYRPYDRNQRREIEAAHGCMGGHDHANWQTHSH